MLRNTLFWIAVLALMAATSLTARRLATRAETPAGSFSPPDLATRNAAIGSTRNLTVGMRRAFAPDPCFAPIPVPGAMDWLTQHRETGQTFAEFLRGKPIKPNRQKSRIYFQPLGAFDDSAPSLASLEEFAGAFFSLDVKILPPKSIDDLPIKTRDRANGVRQLLSTDVLRWLETDKPDDAFCVLAITMEDLYPEESWNFVFGQATLRTGVGVYSFARYMPAFRGEPVTTETQNLALLRSCKVLGHETGHMFGIKHCVHFHCLMNGSNHLEESDQQPIHLCPVCLRKLQSSINFDPVKRYSKLLKFSDSAEWAEESEWLSDRIDTIKNGK